MKKSKQDYIEGLLKESRGAVKGSNDATDILIKKRGETYGSPEIFFSQLAKAKEGITGIPTDPQKEVGNMILFKVIRYMNNPNHLDTLSDIEGYTRIAKMLINNNEDKDMKTE